jgi:hypothetical protein
VADGGEAGISNSNRGIALGKFIAALFGLPLALISGAVGVFACYLAISSALDWNARRSWQPVMAEVLDVRLTTVGDSFSGSGNYRYFFNNTEYKSSRIDYTDRHDFLQDWQIALYEDMVDAKRKGRKVLVFADPRQPARAIVDRDIEWQFVVIWFLMGLGLIAFAIWVPKRIFRRD